MSSICFLKTPEALASVLLNAFASAPGATGAGLQALSAAAPWALVEHLGTLSVYLALGSPPTADEELRAWSACTAMGNTLASLSPTSRSLLSPWAWAHLDQLCSSQSSRLVRPAMRCLCLAAVAEGRLERLLRHLRPAVQLLHSQLEAPEVDIAENGAVLRAAWLCACACEFCDLNQMATATDLGLARPTLASRGKRPRPTVGAGTQLAETLLRTCEVFLSFDLRAPLPALVMALGFALKRHSALLLRAAVETILDAGLENRPGEELLTERSLEVVTSLCDHLGQEADAGAKTSLSTHLSKLARHAPAARHLAHLGLHRRAEPSDGPVRLVALRALRALQRAGLAGHPSALGAAALPALFDVSSRQQGSALLCALARRDPQALPQCLVPGLRDAFAALLWQAPQQLALGPSKNNHLSRAATEAAKAFALSGRNAREKWLRAIVGELGNSFSEDRFPALPSELGLSRRLKPFARRASPSAAKLQETSSRSLDWTDSWPREPRLQLLYSHFLAQVLVALPLADGVHSEIKLVTEECEKFLELRAASAASAMEHEGSISDATLRICIISVVEKALLSALRAELPSRPAALLAALAPRREALLGAVLGDAAQAEQCFAEAQNGVILRSGGSPASRRDRERDGKSSISLKKRKAAGGSEKLKTPKKRKLKGSSEAGTPQVAA
ncbi:unnamed protein product [Durusdinium trenchii]|uniref:HEAT repeat-containing protein 1 n=2 Tax=Durusdinium trenchii TaxID=1381693 RepID=A0ABP0HSZ7_9DINO